MNANARGFSLVTALLMLAAIGLASATIMRNVVTGEQIANNDRLQAQAGQAAQFALRFCENQLALPSGARRVTLLPAASQPAWSVASDWIATRGAAAAAHTLSAEEIGGSVPPRVAPQCLMESTGVAGIATITARGFSADFRTDPSTGVTRSGTVVWLQETIQADGASAPHRRVWQQLLTPPF